jgi:hypothetical protein
MHIDEVWYQPVCRLKQLLVEEPILAGTDPVELCESRKVEAAKTVKPDPEAVFFVEDGQDLKWPDILLKTQVYSPIVTTIRVAHIDPKPRAAMYAIEYYRAQAVDDAIAKVQDSIKEIIVLMGARLRFALPQTCLPYCYWVEQAACVNKHFVPDQVTSPLAMPVFAKLPDGP